MIALGDIARPRELAAAGCYRFIEARLEAILGYLSGIKYLTLLATDTKA